MHLLVEDDQEKRGYKGRLMAISGLTGHGSRVSASFVLFCTYPFKKRLESPQVERAQCGK